MLTNMLHDIGITEEIFAEACIKASSNPTHKMLLSEIMAVDNFLAFKKLMVKRNKDLTEEAYQLMNAREAGIDPDMIYGHDPTQMANEEAEIARAIQESLRFEESKTSQTSSASSTPTDEDEMLRRVLEESKREFDESERLKKIADEEIKSVSSKPVKKTEKVPVKGTKPVKDELPAMKATKAPKELAPIGGSKAAGIAAGVSSEFDIQKHAEETAKQHKINEEKKAKELQKKTMSKEEMKGRMEKLRQQRDALLKQKQEQLKTEWNEYDDKKGSDSTKDRIQKGLEALNIKESDVKYQTETQKLIEIERKKDEKNKKKEEEEAKKDPS